MTTLTHMIADGPPQPAPRAATRGVRVASPTGTGRRRPRSVEPVTAAR